MKDILNFIKKEIFDNCGLSIYEFKTEDESQEYGACRFKINDLKIVCRNAKITPKKIGQFVTFWKRNINGVIEPLDETDQFDFYVVNVKTENQIGQFVFPKSTLIKKGIVSTDQKEGKRGFRVYPNWIEAPNKQAEKTQKWQQHFFYEIKEPIDFDKIIKLFKSK